MRHSESSGIKSGRCWDQVLPAKQTRKLRSERRNTHRAGREPSINLAASDPVPDRDGGVVARLAARMLGDRRSPWLARSALFSNSLVDRRRAGELDTLGRTARKSRLDGGAGRDRILFR